MTYCNRCNCDVGMAEAACRTCDHDRDWTDERPLSVAEHGQLMIEAARKVYQRMGKNWAVTGAFHNAIIHDGVEVSGSLVGYIPTESAPRTPPETKVVRCGLCGADVDKGTAMDRIDGGCGNPIDCSYAQRARDRNLKVDKKPGEVACPVCAGTGHAGFVKGQLNEFCRTCGGRTVVGNKPATSRRALDIPA